MSTVTREIVTRDNLRVISRTRSLAYGITLMSLGLLEILWYGSADSKLHTTIQFGYNTSTIWPVIANVWRVVLVLAGLAIIALTLRAKTLPRFSGLGRFFDAVRGARNIVLVVGGYLVLWPLVLWLGVNHGGALRTMTVDVSLTGYLFGVVSIGVGGLMAWKRFDRRASGILYGGLLLFLLGFLIWVARGSLDLQLTSILASAVAVSTFLMMGSLSGTLCERSGVVNIAIEGQFISGALASIVFASALKGSGVSLTFALVLAGCFGAFFGWILAIMALRYGANQIIVGVVIVAFCTAMSQFLTTQVLDTHQNLNGSYGLPVWAIPGLSHIPLVGPVLFDQNVLVFIAFAAVIIANFALFRTRWGLRVRSVGEKPIASETVGINVVRVRYGAVILGGFIAGVGGAGFTLGPGSPFTYGMTAGYGYIALAIMIFGRWRPYGALMASLLFGFTIALSANLNLYLSQLVIPQQFITALPYVITIAVVSGLVGRIRPPASDGVPFQRR
jgi:simple sugar transport system permease protein